MTDADLPEMPCRELVELVTDYLEDSLSPEDRASLRSPQPEAIQWSSLFVYSREPRKRP